MEKVSAHVYIDPAHSGCTVGAIQSSEGVVLVDSPHRPTRARKWLAEVEALGEVRYLINTEFHIDHTFGNAFLPGWVRDFNGRFARVPANEKDLHRPLLPTDRIDDEFAWQVERSLSQSLTIQYDKVMYIIEPTPEAKEAIGKKVTVIDYPDGRLVVRYQGVSHAYRTFDKIRAVQQADIIENNRLGPLLEMICQQQLEREPAKRSSKGPKRRDQKDARMFKTG